MAEFTILFLKSHWRLSFSCKFEDRVKSRNIIWANYLHGVKTVFQATFRNMQKGRRKLLRKHHLS